MIVSEIRIKGKGDRYSIYIDGAFSCVLEAETLATYKLKCGEEVSEQYITKLRLHSGKIAAFETAIKTLERGLKTEKMIRDKLKEKGYLKETIDETISKLNEYGYISDEEYAKAFIATYRNSKGKRLIKMQLKQKGVSDEIIESSLDDMEPSEEAINMLAQKYMRNKTKDLKTKNKLKNHLLSKGFSFDEINPVAEKMFNGVDDESWI